MDTSINRERRVRDVIVIGASAGGLQAVGEILSQLPADLPAVVGVVIHRGSHSERDWSETLGKNTSLRVLQPADGAPLAHGLVYVAPSDHHMIFDEEVVHLDQGPKVHHTRPAVDPLFFSAARAHGPRVVGVVLTGGGQDGVLGLLAIKAAHGLSLAQTPLEAHSASMPVNAITRDHVDAVLSVAEMGDVLGRLARGAVVGGAS